jgi:hypothetical protein
MVNLKKLLYHLRNASDPFAILDSIRTMTHGKHSGTKNQLIPPCPEYVKLRPGTIARTNMAIGKQYSLITSRQKLGEELSSVRTAEVLPRLLGARRQTMNAATAKTIEPKKETKPGSSRG